MAGESQSHWTWQLGMTLLLSTVISACAKTSTFETLDQPSDVNLIESVPSQAEPPPLESKFETLAWETSSHPERADWSSYSFSVIDAEFARLDLVQDAQQFCPNYSSLDRNQKINFWGQLFSAISYYESAWSPVSRMQETTMGTDPITGRPVYSEGLLQLSYQDTEWAPYCRFDWTKDKSLSDVDPKKTILDPFINLQCGIKIMADQIARKGQITLSSGVYWAVIKEGGRYQQIDGIARITQRLSFCQ